MDSKKFKQKVENKEIQVGVVGFGYIGTCIGAVLAESGYNVKGVEPNKGIVDEINQGTTSVKEPGLDILVKKVVESGNLKVSSDFSVVQQCEVIIITVGTPLGEDFSPDKTQIEAATKSLIPYLSEEKLIMLKSTVPPGTTRELAKNISVLSQISNPLVAFCPERLAEGNAIKDFKTIPVIVGGNSSKCSKLAEIFWEMALGVDVFSVSDPETAELVKLSDNLWIDTNIALANEIGILSDGLGIDSLEVIEAANTLPKGRGKVNILFPGIGVGGYCLTKDPWFVQHLGKKMGYELRIPQSSRHANDFMPDYSFSLIKKEIDKKEKDIQDLKIAILGVSFKNNTGDCRFTPTKKIIQNLIDSGANISIFDPWVSNKELKELVNYPMSTDLNSTLEGADCVAILAGHDEFKALSLEDYTRLCNVGALIFDGRGIYSKDYREKLENSGLVYKGVGR